MKVLNKLIKGIAYFAVLAWVFLGLYVTALLMTSMFIGLVIGGFSLIVHSIPLILQQYSGLFIVVVSVPIALIMWLVSFIKGRKENKNILKAMEGLENKE